MILQLGCVQSVWQSPRCTFSMMLPATEVFPFFFVNGAAALVGVRCRLDPQECWADGCRTVPLDSTFMEHDATFPCLKSGVHLIIALLWVRARVAFAGKELGSCSHPRRVLGIVLPITPMVPEGSIKQRTLRVPETESIAGARTVWGPQRSHKHQDLIF